MACMIQRIRKFFRQRPTGKMLVIVVCLKLFIMFAILRVFFFQPTLRGMDSEQKADAVGTTICEKKPA